MSTPSTTDTNPDGRRAPSTTSHFSRGFEVAAERPWLALVPLVAGLLSLDQLERAARAEVTMQINFGLPSPVAGVWTFLNAPTQSGVSVFGYSGTSVRSQPELLVSAVALGSGGILLLGLLTAVYLGSIDDALADRTSDPLDNLRHHAPVTVTFALLQVLALLGLLSIGLLLVGAGSLAMGPAAFVLPAFLVAILGYYVLTPGVYVGVAAGLGPRAAFRRGVRVALTADYLVFALAYAALVAVCSVPLSVFAFTAGLPTILVTALVAAPVGLALNAATMAFVRRRFVGGTAASGGTDTDGTGSTPTPAVRQVHDEKE